MPTPSGSGAPTASGSPSSGGGLFTGGGGTPMTFVWTSTDGINFKNAKPTYVPAGGRALDPVTLKTTTQWHLFNGDEKGGTLHAVSQDGITFTEKDQFCPFKVTATVGGVSGSRCYLAGDAIALDSPTRYRMYVFINEPGRGFNSIESTDGENWQQEQSSGQYVLDFDANAPNEYYELASPTVARLRDGSYLMAYEAEIPGTPSSILSGGMGQVPGGTASK